MTHGFKWSFSNSIISSCRDFDVEGDSEKCDDYVEIFDGLASWSPVKGRYCGRENPPVIRSETNKLRLVFKSNSHYAGRGFDAVYSDYDPRQGWWLLKVLYCIFCSKTENKPCRVETALYCGRFWDTAVYPEGTVPPEDTAVYPEGTVPPEDTAVYPEGTVMDVIVTIISIKWKIIL